MQCLFMASITRENILNSSQALHKRKKNKQPMVLNAELKFSSNSTGNCKTKFAFLSCLYVNFSCI